jgi:hypothetical protein
VFAVVIGAFGALLIGVISLFFPGMQQPWSLAAALGFVVSLAGLVRPKIMSWPYRVWNKLAVEFGRCASLAVMFVLFYVVLATVGRSGSSLGLARPVSAESLWVPRRSLPPDAYKAQHSQASRPRQKDRHFSPFVSWAIQSGNFWARALLPFIFLLAVLGDAEDQQVPTEIYTLF